MTRWQRAFFSPHGTGVVWYWRDVTAKRAAWLAAAGVVVRLYSEGTACG